MGEATAKAELTLTSEPPTLGDKFPVSTKVNEDEPLKLSVKIGGSPVPDIKWYKDDKELVPDDHVAIRLLPDGTAELEISSAVPGDSGQYKLVAVNPTGIVSTQTAVDVKKKPKKATLDDALPASIAVVEGEPLKLMAKISGHPKPEVKWFKDGRPIRPGSQNAIMSNLPDGTVSLEIESSKPEDAGKYTLTVTNDLGESTCDSSVDITPAPSVPKFVSPLFAVKGTEGFPVRLDAKVTGHPTPVITWMKDGKKLKGETAQQGSKNPDPDGTIRFVIASALPSDAGEYTAIARNHLGEAKSAAKMDVRSRKSDGPEVAACVLTPPRDISVDEGSPIKLTAIIGGNPIPDVSWTRNGEPIDESRFSTTVDGDKIILETEKADKKTDEGDYEIAVSNDLGKAVAASKVAVRKIYSPPSFVQKFTDLQQLPGYDGKFMAKISGLPKPIVTWTFNGEEVTECDNYKIKRDGDICVLFVRDCAPERAGLYACVATNSEGNFNLNFVLKSCHLRLN